MKYKNTSGFRQVLVMEGKKTVVFPDDVVEVTHELINAAFDKVSDDAEVTHKARSIKKPTNSEDKVNFVDFETKLDEVKKEAAQVASSKISEVQSSQSNELAGLRRDFEDFKALVTKRMEILKNVVKTLEYEVGQLYTDEEVDKEQKPFQK